MTDAPQTIDLQQIKALAPIIEEMSIILIIHLGNEKLIAVTVKIGIFLLIRQLIKMKNGI